MTAINMSPELANHALQTANRQIENLKQQVDLYEQLKKVLENDVQKRDDVIAAQDRLINQMRTAMDLKPILMPVFLPPPRMFPWNY